jgi:hypothetical protein
MSSFDSRTDTVKYSSPAVSQAPPTLRRVTMFQKHGYVIFPARIPVRSVQVVKSVLTIPN